MSRLDALRAYTINNAFAAFEEDLKGTLAVGKLADITVLTKDITTVPDEEITQAKVAYTIIGGKVAYRAPQSSGQEAEMDLSRRDVLGSSLALLAGGVATTAANAQERTPMAQRPPV